MNFRKSYGFLIGGCIVVLAISCTGPQLSTITKEVSKQLLSENPIEVKETAPISTPSKEKRKTEPSHSTDNLSEINKYIDDLSMWTYVERVIAPYETIDEAINQDSIKLFHRVIASYNSIRNATQANANSLNNIMEFLLQKKADVNLLNGDGEDALTAFLKIGSNSSRTLDAYTKNQKYHPAEELEPMVLLFIENGADINLKDKSGISTFERIVDFAALDFINTLPDNDIEIDNALSAAVKHNHFELINSLLDKGAILNTSTEEGKDAFLHAAAKIDDLKLFQRVVDNTSDIDFEIVTKYQTKKNALSYMIALGENREQHSQKYFSQKVVYLLDKGIKINERDWDEPNQENSLIVQALKSFSYEDADPICKKLIENGANVNLIHYKRTPLYYLLSNKIYYESEALFSLLIEKGADVNFVKNEKTPLDLMTALFDSEKEDIRNRALKYAEILKSNGAKSFSELGK